MPVAWLVLVWCLLRPLICACLVEWSGAGLLGTDGWTTSVPSPFAFWPFQEGEDKIFLINKLHSVYERKERR